uniref:Cytochrome P450 n=1 Tax=Macrostomum lignano TaxID=282301 RepID=A0A1I8F8N4_9PLAT
AVLLVASELLWQPSKPRLQSGSAKVDQEPRYGAIPKILHQTFETRKASTSTWTSTCAKPFFPSSKTSRPSLDQEAKEHAVILYGKDFSAMNSAMGSVPGHPFFLRLVFAMMEVDDKTGGAGPTTGPDLPHQPAAELVDRQRHQEARAPGAAAQRLHDRRLQLCSAVRGAQLEARPDGPGNRGRHLSSCTSAAGGAVGKN